MKASLKNQLRMVKKRLDKLEPSGTIVRVIREDEDASSVERQLKVEHPRCNPMVIQVVYE